MLHFVLIKDSQNDATYEYYPEGKGQPGIITVSKETGNLNVVELAESDKLKLYAAKMFRKLSEFHRKKTYEEKGIVAWY